MTDPSQTTQYHLRTKTVTMNFTMNGFLNPHPRIYILISERGEGKEREMERWRDGEMEREREREREKH